MCLVHPHHGRSRPSRVVLVSFASAPVKQKADDPRLDGMVSRARAAIGSAEPAMDEKIMGPYARRHVGSGAGGGSGARSLHPEGDGVGVRSSTWAPSA